MAHTCFLHAGVRRQTCVATRRGVFVARRCALPAVGPVCCRDVEDLAPRLLLFVLGGRSGQNQLRRSAGEGCAGERFECMRKCSCAKYRGSAVFCFFLPGLRGESERDRRHRLSVDRLVQGICGLVGEDRCSLWVRSTIVNGIWPAVRVRACPSACVFLGTP